MRKNFAHRQESVGIVFHFAHREVVMGKMSLNNDLCWHGSCVEWSGDFSLIPSGKSNKRILSCFHKQSQYRTVCTFAEGKVASVERKADSNASGKHRDTANDENMTTKTMIHIASNQLIAWIVTMWESCVEYLGKWLTTVQIAPSYVWERVVLIVFIRFSQDRICPHSIYVALFAVQIASKCLRVLQSSLSLGIPRQAAGKETIPDKANREEAPTVAVSYYGTIPKSNHTMDITRPKPSPAQDKKVQK